MTGRASLGSFRRSAVPSGPGTDNLIGLQDSTGTQYYVVQDQLGSVRGLVKRDGTWIMHQRFTPYGTLLARDSAGSSMPRGLHVGWTGREYDAETGFSFHRARYYSADLRRWTQEDPIGYAGGGNLYAYVGGAVMEARDPSGLMEDLSGRGLGFAEASRPNENYELPPWPGGGGKRGGLLNTSYIEDDGYLDDLMDALYAGGNGRSGCYGQLCVYDPVAYKRYVEANTEARATDGQRQPDLSEFLKQTRELSGSEFALLAQSEGFTNAQVKVGLMNHLAGGRVGTSDNWGALSKDNGVSPGKGNQYYGWYFLRPSLFTEGNRRSGALANCALHEYGHAVLGRGHGPGGAQEFANQYSTGRRVCG